MFKLYDTVRLLKNNDELGISTKCTGVIIDILDNGKAYSVEFLDENDETIEDSVFTIFKENELVLLTV